MLISKIISMAEAQTDESYAKSDWIDIYNMCQDELTQVAKILKTKSEIAVTVSSKTASITIANDADLAAAHKVKNIYYLPTTSPVSVETRLRRLPLEDNYSKGWKMDNDKIYLQGLGAETAGTVRADYYKKLAHCVYVSSPESYTPTTPEIPDEYHGIYVSYLCGKCQQREEEPNDKADFMSEYNQAKQIFTIDRISAMEPWTLKDYMQALSSSGGGN